MLIEVIGGCFIGLFFLVLCKEAFGKKKGKKRGVRNVQARQK